MDEWAGEPCERLIAPVGWIVLLLSGQCSLAAAAPSALGLWEILLWPFNFTVAEDDISRAAHGNQVLHPSGSCTSAQG